MDLADKFISRIKEKIREEAVPKNIKKIFEFPIPSETRSGWHSETPLSVDSTQNDFYSHKFPFEKESSHAYTITSKSLKPPLMHSVSMISQTKPIIHKTPFQHSNFKTPTLHFFDESKFKYEDEDDVEIKKMGTGMDEELLEHTTYENDKSLNFCHQTLLTSNPSIKPKDSGNLKMKEAIHSPPSSHVACSHPKGVYRYFHPHLILSVGKTSPISVK